MLKKIYVDEAGNSGPNYLDEKDPYFILAGWIDINDEMQKSDNIKEFTLLLDGKEGKNHKLTKSVEGRKKMVAVLEFMKKKKCVPIIAIANKKYCIPMRIVEVLLDPFYNDRMFGEFESPKYYPLKKEYANRLFNNLSEQELQQFAKIYRGKDMSDMERIVKMEQFIDAISQSLLSKDKEIASLIEGSKKAIKENLGDEEKDISRRMAKQSPNLWLLYIFLLLVEKNCERYGYNIQVVHDEQKKYASSIQDMLQFINTHKELFASNGELKYIDGICFSDSKDSVIIQAADILAGAVNMILKRKNSNWKSDDSFVKILNIVMPYIQDFESYNSKTAYIENEEVYANILKFYER